MDENNRENRVSVSEEYITPAPAPVKRARMFKPFTKFLLISLGLLIMANLIVGGALQILYGYGWGGLFGVTSSAQNVVAVTEAYDGTGYTSIASAVSESMRKSIDGIEKIEFNGGFVDVSIKSCDGNEVKVDIASRNNVNYEMRVENGEKIVIDCDKRTSINIGMAKSDIIEIEIPERFKGDLALTLDAGVADVKNLGGAKLDLKIGAGEIKVKDSEYKELALEMTAGNVIFSGMKSDDVKATVHTGALTLQDSNFENADLKITAGSIKGYDVKIEDLTTNSSSGEIKLQGQIGKTYTQTSAGKVVLDYEKMPENILVDASLGSVDILLPDDSKFKLSSNIVMGELNNEFATKDNADNKITVNVNMGTVNIKSK